MKKRQRFFPLPPEIFALGLCPGEIAVYAYLMNCENRKTHRCYPSYRNIGQAVKLSINTVRKYVSSLCDKGLIYSENTNTVKADGLLRNGPLMYTILPIRDVVERYRRSQLDELDLTVGRQQASARRARLPL